MTEDSLSYPIGPFAPKEHITPDVRGRLIDDLAAQPAKFRAAVTGLSQEQLDTPYRPGGWTVRQVIHHVPDSHLNSYVRFKWAVTEDDPAIKVYDQAAWGATQDSREGNIEPSLTLLEALHERWTAWLRTLSEDDWKRTFRHPELGSVSLERNLQLYAWHGEHHLAHVSGLKDRMGW